MAETPVIILGAGATKACGGPLTVVEYVDDDIGKPACERTSLDQHPTGQRFRAIFGEGPDWHATGFRGWLDEQRRAERFPFARSSCDGERRDGNERRRRRHGHG